VWESPVIVDHLLKLYMAPSIQLQKSSKNAWIITNMLAEMIELIKE
jgi:hypothetical protein